MAKVVIIDNYDRENISDHLHAADLSQEAAEREAKEMNSKFGPNSASYFVVKPDDYKLYKFEP